MVAGGHPGGTRSAVDGSDGGPESEAAGADPVVGWARRAGAGGGLVLCAISCRCWCLGRFWRFSGHTSEPCPTLGIIAAKSVGKPWRDNHPEVHDEGKTLMRLEGELLKVA